MADIASAIIGGLSAAMDLTGGLVGAQMQQDAADMQAEENERLFDKQVKENRDLLEIQHGREDNAIRRRAQDLYAAGINPLIAGGVGAAGSAGSAAPRAGLAQQSTAGQVVANSFHTSMDKVNNVVPAMADVGARGAAATSAQAQADQTQAETQQIRKMMPIAIDNAKKQGLVLDAEKEKALSITANTQGNTLLLAAQKSFIQAQDQESRVRAAKAAEDMFLIQQNVAEGKAREALLKSQRDLTENQKQQAISIMIEADARARKENEELNTELLRQELMKEQKRLTASQANKTDADTVVSKNRPVLDWLNTVIRFFGVKNPRTVVTKQYTINK